jgi:hypothetical protein
MKKLTLMLVVVMLLISATAVFADTTYDYEWNGKNGLDSEDCSKVGEDGRTPAGWIHWVFTDKDPATTAKLTLDGTGSGVYDPTKPGQWYTPYFELDGLTAVVTLPVPSDGHLTISDYCPGGYEDLDVKKTVVTTFTRTHDWSIEKSVTPAAFYLYTNGSGDGKATWSIDVTYEDFEDSDWNVSGVITIENIGTLDAVITDVEDVLAGSEIPADCSLTFPYTLPVGETVTCTYDEDGYVTGNNVVTVTTERDTYSDIKPVVWGAPTSEVNKTVTVVDESDLFGTVTLGTVTAPNDKTFTYSKDFAWKDYGQDDCGDYKYNNTAKIIGDGDLVLDFDTAELIVKVQCFIFETAYAKGEGATCFIPTFSNWGWTNFIASGSYTMPLYAAAGQCDTSKGTLVGSVTVNYVNGFVGFGYNVDPGYMLKETHAYAGEEMFPMDKKGKATVAPGAYYNLGGFTGDIWVIAHAVVGIPDPNFGP